jgi:hypothetical protein
MNWYSYDFRLTRISILATRKRSQMFPGPMYFVGAVLQGTHPNRPKPGIFHGSGCAIPNDVGASSWPLRPRMWAERHPRQRLPGMLRSLAGSANSR